MPPLPQNSSQDFHGQTIVVTGGAGVPCSAIAPGLAAHGANIVLLDNISSMSALRPLTRIVGYSAAKAAVSNFTAWFAVHMGREYSPHIRVNALAPRFFLTEQNRFSLTERETGGWSPRGQQILATTPLGRLGTREDLLGAALFLLSEASTFVTGIVMPVDGGFSAYSGV